MAILFRASRVVCTPGCSSSPLRTPPARPSSSRRRAPPARASWTARHCSSSRPRARRRCSRAGGRLREIFWSASRRGRGWPSPLSTSRVLCAPAAGLRLFRRASSCTSGDLPVKTDRPDPNLPRGVQAFLFDAAERRRKAEDSVVRRLQEAGLREVILPVLDFADPYAGVTAEGDERVYRFLDRQGNTLSLRADFTPMAARVVAPRLGTLSEPVSLFYRGDVVRDEETGVGGRA